MALLDSLKALLFSMSPDQWITLIIALILGYFALNVAKKVVGIVLGVLTILALVNTLFPEFYSILLNWILEGIQILFSLI